MLIKYADATIYQVKKEGRYYYMGYKPGTSVL
jgi:hypothetical protein